MNGGGWGPGGVQQHAFMAFLQSISGCQADPRGGGPWDCCISRCGIFCCQELPRLLEDLIFEGCCSVGEIAAVWADAGDGTDAGRGKAQSSCCLCGDVDPLEAAAI